MSKLKQEKTNFIVQGSILAIASIFSRVIGLLYRIPMTNIIGDVGNNYYAAAFEVYNILLLISCYSIPLSVSKIISVYVAKGERKNIIRVFRCALLFAISTGIVAYLILIFGAEFLTGTILKTPQSVFALYVLAPTIVIFSIMGVIRGLFQGLGTMMPTAFSQIIEQLINAFVSVGAAYFLFKYGTKIGGILGDKEEYGAIYGAAGGTFGTTTGALVSLIFLLIVLALFWSKFKNQGRTARKYPVASYSTIFKILMMTIIPVLLSTTLYNLSGILEQVIYKNMAAFLEIPKHEVKIVWGIYSGKIRLLLNVPVSIAASMAASVVPSLTAAYTDENMKLVRRKINTSMRFVMLIAVPCAVGMGVLAKPILMLLFHETSKLAVQLLQLASFSIIFYSLSTLTNGILQGINRMKIPVRNAIIALSCQVVIAFGLMYFTKLEIYGILVSNICYSMIMTMLNSFAIRKHMRYRQEFIKSIFVPLISAGIMGVVVYYGYMGVHLLVPYNPLATLVSIIIGVIVYGLAVLLLKGINKEELSSFPMGGKLSRIFVKMHIMK